MISDARTGSHSWAEHDLQEFLAAEANLLDDNEGEIEEGFLNRFQFI
jgi:hypothetical protein